MSYLQSLYVVLAFVLISGFSHSGFSQEAGQWCGTDAVHEHKMRTDSAYAIRYEQMQERIHEKVNELQRQRKQQENQDGTGEQQVYTIPLVVHVIHKGEPVGTGSNVSNEEIQEAVAGMNEQFRNIEGNGVDTEIEFCLATRDPSGSATTGINRVDGSSVPGFANIGVSLPSDNCGGANLWEVQDLSRWPVLDYYNVWVVHNICGNVAGFAYYPNGEPKDGTFMDYKYLDASHGVFVHELGHGFDLRHTFEGDDNGAQCPDNFNCAVDGDLICDTPPHKRSDCGTNNPCSSSGNWDNSRFNYMSYCDHSNERYTQGQKDRMMAALSTTVRSKLRNSDGCEAPVSCGPPSASATLDVNNVSAGLLNGGDLWWNLQGDARYEIPKGSGKHSIFAGGLWMGGMDNTGQLRLAAQQYRDNGSDYRPGPIPEDTSTQGDMCRRFDQIYQVERSDLNTMADLRETFDVSTGGTINVSLIPENVRNWPARGNPYFEGADGHPYLITQDLAPYVNVDGEPGYDPARGDYPKMRGDEMYWWVFKDVGKPHTETGGQPLGVEVHGSAYAFSTGGHVDNTTFYQYKVLNKTRQLDSLHVGMFVDFDIGNYEDDYVGCDVSRNLGIGYNGDDFDNGSSGYGNDPPLAGVDFLNVEVEGQPNTGMSKFGYFNNSQNSLGNPEKAVHYYNYLTGTWKNGDPFTYGGNGFNTGQEIDHVFPNDPSNSIGWSECSHGTSPGDRRAVMSSGPYAVEPGETITLDFAAIWAQCPMSGCQADFDCLREASDSVQAKFDNEILPAEALEFTLGAPHAGCVGEYQLCIDDPQEDVSYTWQVNNTIKNGPCVEFNCSPSNVGPNNLIVQATNDAGSRTKNFSFHCQTDPEEPQQPVGATEVVPHSSQEVYYVPPDPNIASYNWTVPDGWEILAGQGSDSIVVTPAYSTGEVCVQAENQCGTTSKACLSTVISGIDEAPAVSSFDVFPNPNKGTFSIAMQANTSENAVLQVLNATGKVVVEERLPAISGRYRHEISMPRAASGFYVVRLKNEDGTINEQVIVE